MYCFSMIMCGLSQVMQQLNKLWICVLSVFHIVHIHSTLHHVIILCFNPQGDNMWEVQFSWVKEKLHRSQQSDFFFLWNLGTSEAVTDLFWAWWGLYSKVIRRYLYILCWLKTTALTFWFSLVFQSVLFELTWDCWSCYIDRFIYFLFPAGGMIGGGGINHLFVRSSEPNVILDCKPTQPGEPYDIFMKVSFVTVSASYKTLDPREV